MTRKPKQRGKPAAKRKLARKSAKRRGAARPATHGPLDAFIVAAARALDLPAKKTWLPAIKTNLRITLQHAATVSEFELPDGAEPAPVFRA